MKKDKLWFKAKMYGWGWYPISKEGWGVLALYVTAVWINVRNADIYSNSLSDTLINIVFPFVVNTIYLLIICYCRGEKPKWRWGEK
ncbi:MAG: hypothetical protein NTV02_03275 [Candidatus Zambryskibacteria bacterium]|nr:hypothetical protein [Candidatus Zambryskibacteria bacterium]